MEFRVLGPLEVEGEVGPLALGGPKQRAVLAHLILRANRIVPAELLIDELWGEEPPETARNTLQTYVYRLRKLLGDGRIEGRGGGYVLTAAPEEVDASRFEVMLKRAKASIESDPAEAAATLSDALTLWRGPPLADLSDEPSLRGEIARLEELHLSATERRIAAEIAMGGHSTVVSELEALTARYPLRERMWANLMTALYRLGRQAEALSSYERARQVLSEELGTEPSAELQRLHEQILRRDPSLGRPEPVRPVVRPSRVDLPAGTEFAGYRIERTLGRGGMSVVYLAEHEWLQRRVALKVLAPQLAEDERFRERFVRESRLAASLDHPNVIPIYEAGASGGDLFIAMRYVGGTDLRTLLHEAGALEPPRAIAIVHQVAAALDAAHEQGLVHRDVKPGNVLLARPRGAEEGEHVYLSDFGLTKRSASDSGVTGTGQFVGTLDYAAPEQFTGGTPAARTDVYSLGCVLFECLAGRPPFRAENDAGLMYAHQQEQPPTLTAERADLPRAIDAVITRAMAKAPEERYESAGELASQASRALGLGAGAGGAAAAPSRTRLRLLAAAIAVGLALLAGVVVSSLLRGDAPQVPGEAVQQLTASPGPSPPPPAFRTVERPLTSEEERLLSYIPAEVAADCLPLDRDEPIQGELAALVCRTEDVEVLYKLFAERSAMDQVFRVNANIRRAPEGECATDHLALTNYTIEGEVAGRVLCYTTRAEVFGARPASSHIEWTADDSAIYAHAIRNDLSDLTLYEWWLSSSGPVLAAGTGGSVAKDRPRIAGVRPPAEGFYLAALAPPEGCGFHRTTCVMHLEGTRYDILNVGDTVPFDVGSVWLRKPASIVFAPTTGFCYRPGQSSRPARHTWTESADRFSFERTGGGRCAGPGFFDGPWTRAPDGLIALEEGGEIEIVDAGGSLVRSMTTDTDPNAWPEWSPDGSRIVFAGADGEGFDLYVMNEDGSGLERLTDAPGDEFTPAWSPVGTRIVFGFDDGGDTDFRSGLGVIGLDGSRWTEVLARENQRVESPAWSPDGSRIAFTVFTEEGPVPYVVHADGDALVKLRDDPGVVLSWTPDGRRVLISAGGSFVSVRPDGSDVRVFVAEPPEDGRLVIDWSPDGRWIIASSPSGLNNNVYLMRADGSEVFQIGYGSEPSWRPETD
jgi:serine/threonine-protein kinase